MSRINEIDNFLRDAAQFAKNYSINDDIVYEALKEYDFTPEEYRKGNNISVYFDYWIEYFKNKPNISVFRHGLQSHFLQFWSNGKYDDESIKLYVSVKDDAMLKSVNEIFNHMENIEATHCSKVADRVRSDSIVLRIKNVEDVEDIIDFINNNKLIKKDAKKTNPFMLREGIVGLAYDDNLSYNSAIAFLVSEYIKDRREKQELNNVNCIDFSNYVSNYSRNLITDKDFLNNFMKTKYYKEDKERLKDYCNDSQILANMKRVFDLVDFNLNENNTYNDFITMYLNSKDEKEQLEKDFKKLLINKYELFMSNCRATYEKYGRLQLKGAIDHALAGNYSYFTNDNNLRNDLKKYLSPEDFKSVVDGFITSSEMVFIKSEGETCARIIENMYLNEEENISMKK